MMFSKLIHLDSTGIISHVEALKERISTQIQLERNGQGYSSLRVV
jgi:exonuclease SbcC